MTEAQKQAYEELYYMTVELLDELDELKRKIVAQQAASEALWDLPEDCPQAFSRYFTPFKIIVVSSNSALLGSTSAERIP